ncbi:MAG: hypothetical protein IPJ81_14510 [Chitinophagaceae bacterium]|nr:hypothetical protein [Chitinophagaceae bacterium]
MLKFKSWYASGQQKSEEEFKNESRHGIYDTWHENGQKSMEGDYVEDNPEGLTLSWFENGKKGYEGSYKNGEMDGLWQHWSDDGQLNQEVYYVNKVKQKKIIWQGDSTKYKEVIYKYINNKEHASSTSYYENGNIQRQENTIDDIQNGMHIDWHENGQKSIEGKYVNGDLEV